MPRPWQIIDSAETDEGRLELLRRGERDFIIKVDGRVLMNGSAHRSERVLAELACDRLPKAPAPRVLIGGLGLGFTLRAALDSLPQAAEVVVAELNPVVERWCRGPLRALTDAAVEDPRVKVAIADVADVIAEGGAAPYDAIILDLYEGPCEATRHHPGRDRLWGPEALQRTRVALKKRGVLAVWGEDPDTAFERRLNAAGLLFERRRPGKGSARHVVYLAQAKG
jgi:spermidine synthase